MTQFCQIILLWRHYSLPIMLRHKQIVCFFVCFGFNAIHSFISFNLTKPFFQGRITMLFCFDHLTSKLCHEISSRMLSVPYPLTWSIVFDVVYLIELIDCMTLVISLLVCFAIDAKKKKKKNTTGFSKNNFCL